MEMRIVVSDAGSASALAERLTAAYSTACISRWVDRPEVEVRIEAESDRIVLGVLETVERWLDQASSGSAEMWLGKNSYRLARWAPVEIRQ
ncbi:MAG: hypothetical protein ABSB96_00830 [Gaiellaceae bacterium]